MKSPVFELIFTKNNDNAEVNFSEPVIENI